MAAETIEKKPGWQLILRLVARLFSVFFKYYRIELTNKFKIPKSYSLYQMLSQSIEEHFATITLKQLSEIYHYTPDYIGRTITLNSGLSFRDDTSAIPEATSSSIIY